MLGRGRCKSSNTFRGCQKGDSTKKKCILVQWKYVFLYHSVHIGIVLLNTFLVFFGYKNILLRVCDIFYFRKYFIVNIYFTLF